MSANLLKFVSVEQQQPEKRAAALRRDDFDEIYARFDPDRATEQGLALLTMRHSLLPAALSLA